MLHEQAAIEETFFKKTQLIINSMIVLKQRLNTKLFSRIYYTIQSTSVRHLSRSTRMKWQFGNRALA